MKSIGSLSKLLLCLAFVAISVAACGGGNTTRDTASLDGTKWQLVSFNRAKPIGKRPITIEFQGFKMSGHAGCNRYGGQMRLEGKRILLNTNSADDSKKEAEKNQLFSTKMYCPQPQGLMDQERRYLSQLQSSRRYTIQGDELRIKDGADVMIFKQMAK